MFLCAFIAFLGAGVTYLFTPKYGALELEIEENYLLLEHPCLLPSAADLMQLETSKESKGQGMMFEVVEAVYDEYADEGYVGDDKEDGAAYSQFGAGLVLENDRESGREGGREGDREGEERGGIRGINNVERGGYQAVPMQQTR